MGRTSTTAPKTYRERQLERAARLREWADSRERKAEAAYARARGIGDSMPFGQPVLAGHHSAGRHRRDLERMQSAMDQVVEHTRKAEEMRRRADSIEAAANRAIYSDDEDALERLREKLADLEAQRDRIKAYNATARKGNPDPSLLDDKQRAELEKSLRLTPYRCEDGQFPPYVLKNLGSNIRRIRQRIEELER